LSTALPISLLSPAESTTYGKHPRPPRNGAIPPFVKSTLAATPRELWLSTKCQIPFPVYNPPALVNRHHTILAHYFPPRLQPASRHKTVLLNSSEPYFRGNPRLFCQIDRFPPFRRACPGLDPGVPPDRLPPDHSAAARPAAAVPPAARDGDLAKRRGSHKFIFCLLHSRFPHAIWEAQTKPDLDKPL
jgi:hypothetical protein